MNKLIAHQKNDDEYFRRAKTLVDCIMTNRIFVVVNRNNHDCMFLQKSEKYIYQFTTFLVDLGYLAKSRSHNGEGHLSKYVPNQNIAFVINSFMQDAKEIGLHDIEKDWRESEYDTIWL